MELKKELNFLNNKKISTQIQEHHIVVEGESVIVSLVCDRGCGVLQTPDPSLFSEGDNALLDNRNIHAALYVVFPSDPIDATICKMDKLNVYVSILLYIL